MFKYVYTFNPYECAQDIFRRMLITKSSCLLHIPDVTQVNRGIKEADLSIDRGSWSMKQMGIPCNHVCQTERIARDRWSVHIS